MPPNFFIVGAPKCGTTSIHNWLSKHPQVFMSNPKEPHFWNKDMSNSRDWSSEQYFDLFKNGSQKKILGEASTWYLYSSKAVANIENELSNKPKYLVMIRNPIEMLKSLYKHNYRRFHENAQSLEKAWQLRQKRKKGKRIPKDCLDPNFLNYGEACSLGTQLEHMLDIVPRERVFIIVLDDLKTNPRQEYLSLLKFLNIDDDKRKEFPVKNKGSSTRIRCLQKLIVYAREIKKKIGLRYNFGFLSKLINLNKNSSDYSLEISNEIELEITDYFFNEIKKISKILERDFSYWLSS